ncbi:MAG: hypothetical protein SGJ27_26190 [Candidatus Melainabacteria bacterium]|nr:hypothetical protein [Candidatus Melainabacteria bacterium]
MFIHQKEGDDKIPSSWQTLSRPGYPGYEVNRIDEENNLASTTSTISEETEQCIDGVCSLNWKPQRRDVA